MRCNSAHANPAARRAALTTMLGRIIMAVAPAALGIAGAFLAPPPASAFVFMPTFGRPSLDAGLVEGGTPGTSYTVGGGALVLKQGAGQSNGYIWATTETPVGGDFEVRVTALGSNLGRADSGIVVGTPDWTYSLSDVFINGNSGTVNANIFQPFFGTFLLNTAMTVTLEISRVGDTITDYIDSGAGLVPLNSGTSAALGGAINIGLFLLSAEGDMSADQVTFTNFSIDADLAGNLPATGIDVQSIPEPTTAGLLAFGALAFGCMRMATRRGTKLAPLALANAE